MCKSRAGVCKSRTGVCKSRAGVYRAHDCRGDDLIKVGRSGLDEFIDERGVFGGEGNSAPEIDIDVFTVDDITSGESGVQSIGSGFTVGRANASV